MSDRSRKSAKAAAKQKNKQKFGSGAFLFFSSYHHLPCTTTGSWSSPTCLGTLSMLSSCPLSSKMLADWLSTERAARREDRPWSLSAPRIFSMEVQHKLTERGVPCQECVCRPFTRTTVPAPLASSVADTRSRREFAVAGRYFSIMRRSQLPLLHSVPWRRRYSRDTTSRPQFSLHT
ncbi:hypothetical protein EDD85DRAFT_438796 [Armillaria nabsnona]|nr:hypothetical protein EDD85DRAFT_438796 [Armillaria nabsnona]